MLSESSPIFLFSNNEWESFSDFAINLNRQAHKQNLKIWFDGEGFLSIAYDNSFEKHYLFSINDTLFSSAIVKTGSGESFVGVIELNSKFLTSELFRNNKGRNGNYYKKLEASVEVDCKPYDYGNEHKLLLSKSGKVDLLFSQQLSYNNSNPEIVTQKFNSLEQAVLWQKKVNEIDARTAEILARKKEKK